ncbi:MAG: YihY/virulence factor BrkB family protein [Acidimicrobiia bacterium]
MDLDVMARLERQGERWRWLGFVLAVHHRASELHGSQMASAITLTAFITLFPLLLVAIAVIGFVSASDNDVAARIVENLGLTGRAAETVTDAIATAEKSRRLASVIGVVGLLWTGLGFAGALAYAYNTAWQVKGRGIRDRAYALGWFVGLGVLAAATFATTSAIEWLGAAVAPLLLLAGIAINVALFLWTSWILPNRKVGIRPLLPAAIVGGVVFEALKVIGTLVVPRLVADSSALYGTIGVVFATLAWLLILGRLVVYVATIEVVSWEAQRGTQRTVIELPALPDSHPVASTRSGGREEA